MTRTPNTPSANYGSQPFDEGGQHSSSDSSAQGPSRPPSEPPQPESHRDEDSDDIIRLGPVVGVGLPNLLSIGGMLKLTRFLGAGVNMGLIPSTKISLYGDATLSYQEYDVYGRLFPFGGGFFLGAGVGYATVKGTLTESFDTTQLGAAAAAAGLPNPMVYESRGSVRTLVLTPQVGYFYTTSIGLSLGLDLGAQVPIAPSEITYDSKLSLPADTPAAVKEAIEAQYVAPNDKEVENTLQTLGRTPLPTLNVRVGWLF